MLSKIREWLRFPYPSDYVFAAVFFMVLFAPLVFTNYLNDNVETPKLALWIICLAAAIIFYLRRQPVVRFHRGSVIVLGLLVGWSVLSTVGSLDVITSIFGLYGRFTSSVIFYGLWSLTVLLLVSTLTKEKFIFLCKVLVFMSVVIAIFGILQNFGIAYYAGLEETVRPLVPSFLGNPNFSSMYIASVLPLVVWFIVQAKNLHAKLYYVLGALVIIVGLGLFGSRGSLLATACELVVMAGLFLLFRLGRKLVIVTILTLVVTIVVTGLFLQSTRPGVIGQTVELSETTVDSRFVAWGEALTMIKHRPIFGTGPGNFFIGINENATPSLANSERFDDAHNLFLHLAANGGIPLLLIFLAIISLVVIGGWRSFKTTRDSLVLVLWVAILGWLISSSFNPVAVGCWLLLAVLVAGVMINFELQTFKLNKAVRTSTIIFSSLAIICACSFVLSDFFAFKTLEAYGKRQFPQTLRYARLAVYTNPTNPTVSAYWAISRIKLGQAPGPTESLISYLVNLHPRSPRVQMMSATLYYLLHSQTQDEKYLVQMNSALENALSLQPNQTYIFSHAAFMYYKIGNRDLATYYTRQALITEPRQFYSWILLAQLSKEAGHREALVNALEHAQQLQSGTPFIKQVLEQARTLPDLSKVELLINFPEPIL